MLVYWRVNKKKPNTWISWDFNDSPHGVLRESQEGHEEEEAQARWRHPWLLNTLHGLTLINRLYKNI